MEIEESTGCDYEVFLSFRGPDTRKDITDYLYTSMIDAGIRVYKDDEELRIGEEIGGQLLQAIEQSKISIPIFSKGYADSPWCLRELVKMVESKNTRKHKIRPIFYDVAPSEVKYQTENYGNAIVSHANKERFDPETINKWKAALSEVGALMGWDLHGKPNSTNRGKGKFVREVVDNVLTELKTAYLEVSDCFVEVDNHVDEIMRMIGAYDDETKIVGIHGIGGMGKTTLAKIVYNKLSHDFPDYCFLSNVRETEITRLQNQLISDILKKKWCDINYIMEGKKVIKERLCSKKVLLLLDDVDDASQLDALVQKREWFGKGSKIIITTRDRGILKVPAIVDGTYELAGMDFDHSLQLFSKHAFRRDYPLEQYISRSKRMVEICRGLPLALAVTGSLLSGRSMEKWDATLKDLKESPQEDVGKKLMISINALNGDQRKIFLDIACFFIGIDKRIVIHMWKKCKFSPDQSLQILQQRSLIKIREDNQLWMHDWLRDIGRDSIQQASDKKPEEQKWVWTHDQALEVLEKTQIGVDVHGIQHIEAICLEFDELSRYSLIKECLPRLLNLRFLQVKSKGFMGNTKSIPHKSKVDELSRYSLIKGCLPRLLKLRFLQVKSKDFKGNTESIPQATTSSPPILPKLRWLSWNYFHMDLDLTNFSLKKLVILDFSRSNITEEWDGWNHIKLAKDLKVLNLTGCKKLRKTPDFSPHINLERLILKGCESLVHIDPSIGHLKRLVFLNLKGCFGLCKLPDEMGELESLIELLLDSTSIKEIPEWRQMKKLEILSLVNCRSLKKFNFLGFAASPAELSSVDCRPTQLAKSMENFSSLIELDLSRSGITELLDSIGNMKNLKVLKMQSSSIRKLPSAIGMLEKLEELVAGGGGASLMGGEIPANIGNLQFLRTFLFAPTKIPAMPRLPESLTTLRFASTTMAKLPNLANLFNLTSLSLRLTGMHDDEEAESCQWIERLHKLEFLDLTCPGIFTLSDKIISLSQLKRLRLRCSNLVRLPKLPTNLSDLYIDCARLKTLDVSDFKMLEQLTVQGTEVTEIEGLEGLEDLKSLELTFLPLLVELPDLTSLKKLKKIHLKGCPKLFEIRCNRELLEKLRIVNCPKIANVGEESHCGNSAS